MGVLTREQILEADDLPRELIDVPEWGEGAQVYVATLSSYDKDQFEASILGKNGGQNLVNIRGRLAAATVVDEKGQRLFDDKDASKLGKKSCAALDRVFDVARRLNRMADEDVEELAKNS